MWAMGCIYPELLNDGRSHGTIQLKLMTDDLNYFETKSAPPTKKQQQQKTSAY